MARIRSIKPEVHLDTELWDAECAAGLPLFRAFTGLWCHADREGRFEWDARVLKTQILPWWDGDFRRCLDTLEDIGKIVSYEVDGRRYGLVRNFCKHQRINTREAASRLPEPTGEALSRVAPMLILRSQEAQEDGKCAPKRQVHARAQQDQGTAVHVQDDDESTLAITSTSNEAQQSTCTHVQDDDEAGARIRGREGKGRERKGKEERASGSEFSMPADWEPSAKVRKGIAANLMLPSDTTEAIMNALVRGYRMTWLAESSQTRTAEQWETAFTRWSHGSWNKRRSEFLPKKPEPTAADRQAAHEASKERKRQREARMLEDARRELLGSKGAPGRQEPAKPQKSANAGQQSVFSKVSDG